MFARTKSSGNRRSFSLGYTIIEVMAVIFIIAVSVETAKFVSLRYGKTAGIGAGLFGGMVSSAIVVLFYCWIGRQNQRRLQDVRERYTSIYRVTSPPTDEKSIKRAEGAEIRVGDYGWEAGPLLKKSGLIYLQGLRVDWRVVWHAGFRPDQIEKVTQKPCSQYDRWIPYWVKGPAPPPCPFPILERKTPAMGLPHNRHLYGISRP